MTSNPFHLEIVPGHQQPIYRQITVQIGRAIAARTLAPGESLTPFRELAQLLVVSPLAVKKAYEDLVLEGLCRRQDDGFRVVDRPSAALHGAPEAVVPEPELSLKELRLAREIQCRLLPPGRVEGDGFVVAARNYPARIVAGDFYDVIHHTDGSLGVVVADVAGKGLGPSLIMASVKAVMPFLAAERSVEATLRELNRRLYADLGAAGGGREFVALAYARFDSRTGQVRFANAGLPAPLLLRGGRQPIEQPVPWPRLPLGLRPTLDYRGAELVLEPGDRLLFYTDGIPEARVGADEPLGYEAMTELASAVPSEDPPDAWLDAFLERVWDLTRRRGPATAELATSPNGLDDDWTALLIERS